MTDLFSRRYERRRLARVWSCLKTLKVAAFGTLVSSITSTLKLLRLDWRKAPRRAIVPSFAFLQDVNGMTLRDVAGSHLKISSSQKRFRWDDLSSNSHREDYRAIRIVYSEDCQMIHS